MKRIHGGAQSELYPQEHFLGGLAAVGARFAEELRAGWYKALQAVMREFGGISAGVATSKPTDSESKDGEEKEDDQGRHLSVPTRDPGALCKIALWVCVFRQNDVTFLNECRIVDNLHDVINESTDTNVSLLAWNVLKMIVLTGVGALGKVRNSRLRKGIYKLLGDVLDVFGALIDDSLPLLSKGARDILDEKTDFAVSPP